MAKFLDSNGLLSILESVKSKSDSFFDSSVRDYNSFSKKIRDSIDGVTNSLSLFKKFFDELVSRNQSIVLEWTSKGAKYHTFVTEDSGFNTTILKIEKGTSLSVIDPMSIDGNYIVSDGNNSMGILCSVRGNRTINDVETTVWILQFAIGPFVTANDGKDLMFAESGSQIERVMFFRKFVPSGSPVPLTAETNIWF